MRLIDLTIEAKACWNIAMFRLRPDDCRDKERVAHVGADAAHPCWGASVASDSLLAVMLLSLPPLFDVSSLE